MKSNNLLYNILIFVIILLLIIYLNKNKEKFIGILPLPINILPINTLPIQINPNDVAYNYDKTISDTSLNAWMKNLSDLLRLSQLSLPGTHDTMTYTLEDIKYHGKCQSIDLETQLNAGLRVFDIRCRPVGKQFTMHHGIYYLNSNFDDVMNILIKFLSKNPSEFVIIRMKSEYIPESGSLTYNEIFKIYWNKYLKYFYQSKNIDPNVKDMRSKIVVIQSSGNGIPLSTFDIQDKYEISTNWDLYEKWNNVKNHLLKSANDGILGKKKFINFLNASGGSLPYFVASGKSSPETNAPQLLTGKLANQNDNTYADFARISCLGDICSIAFTGLNYLVEEFLENQPKLIKTGIVMMDFPGSRLIKQIINQNASNKITSYKPCRFGTKCTYSRDAGRIPDKRPCDSGMRDDGTSCWEDWKCETKDNGYYNYSWGSVGCTDGRPFRVEGYSDCYKTWIAKLETTCTGCGCIKKTLFDRQYCANGGELQGGFCYPQPKPGFTCNGIICNN